MEIGKHFFLEYAGMQFRNPIYGMTANNGKVCHANIFRMIFLNEGHSVHFPHVTMITFLHLIHKLLVDLKNDVQMPG